MSKLAIIEQLEAKREGARMGGGQRRIHGAPEGRRRRRNLWPSLASGPSNNTHTATHTRPPLRSRRQCSNVPRDRFGAVIASSTPRKAEKASLRPMQVDANS